MPSAYDPAEALPLRVPSELRDALDTLVAALPPNLRLSRNSVAVAALHLGLNVLRDELGRDLLAVHRELALTTGPVKPSAPPPNRAIENAPSAPAAPVSDPLGFAEDPEPTTVRTLLVATLRRDESVAVGERGWSIAALADAVGCDRRSIRDFSKTGRGMLRRTQVKLWSALLATPPVRGGARMFSGKAGA